MEEIDNLKNQKMIYLDFEFFNGNISAELHRRLSNILSSSISEAFYLGLYKGAKTYQETEKEIKELVDKK